jgi:hypothetical protein
VSELLQFDIRLRCHWWAWSYPKALRVVAIGVFITARTDLKDSKKD